MWFCHIGIISRAIKREFSALLDHVANRAIILSVIARSVNDEARRSNQASGLFRRENQARHKTCGGK
ncbi:MAG: hypothetical protein A2103_02990 [Gammaproteobacteria bacterium GWF2_41_13]|nr:MAG: hypothetical protein A2103_02990 [Gammaproteobacteria bacterium GWF2_41_13]